jgi:hypothetical protein
VTFSLMHVASSSPRDNYIQYNFQHSELTNKRNKLAHMKRAMEQVALEREQKLLKECESIRSLQARINEKARKLRDGTAMPPKLAMELIHIELSGGVSDEELKWPDWAKLLEEKADEVTREATEYQYSVNELDSILQGYKNNYGLKWQNNGESNNVNEGLSAATMRH